MKVFSNFQTVKLITEKAGLLVLLDWLMDSIYWLSLNDVTFD